MLNGLLVDSSKPCCTCPARLRLRLPDCMRLCLHAQATVLITGMTGSICCEHKLGGGRKRCSYPPSSTVQDWLLLQHTAARSSGSNSNTAPASQRHAPGVSVVAVSHDAAGFSGAWLLDCVIVQHLSSGEWWQFDNRAGWIKGTQQAKAVAAARGAAGQESEGAAQEGDSSAAKPLPQQLQLSASGVAANCPLEAMPRSSSSSSGRVTQQGEQAGMPPQPQQVQPPAPAGGANCSSTCAPSTRADTAAAYGAGDDASTVSNGDAGLCAAPGGFVPLDDVELKLRGSSRGSRSRSCSPSPTHRTQQQQQQQRTGQDRAEAARSAASAAAAAVVEAAGLRSIAAVVSRAAAPAAAATAAAWDALGASWRSSAGELRHPTAARRVSGSIAQAKMVPLQAGGSSSSRSSSGGGSSEGCKLAALQAPETDAETASGAAPAEGCCRVSRTLTHSSDGTPCRLVRCNSSYLGRTSSSSAQQLQEQGRQQRGVHFQGWAEQVVFDPAAMQGRCIGSSGTSSSSSIQSFTEEQLLEAQSGWEFVRPPDASSSYTTLIDSQMAGAAAAPAGRGQAGAVAAVSSCPFASIPASGATGGSGELQEVALIETKPVSLLDKARGGGCEYQLRLHTANKVSAALPAGQQVFVEVLGSTGALLTTQLPR